MEKTDIFVSKFVFFSYSTDVPFFLILNTFPGSTMKRIKQFLINFAIEKRYLVVNDYVDIM